MTDKTLRLCGFQIRWTKGDPDDTLVVVDIGGNSEALELTELRELITGLQQALNEVDPPKNTGLPRVPEYHHRFREPCIWDWYHTPKPLYPIISYN